MSSTKASLQAMSSIPLTLFDITKPNTFEQFDASIVATVGIHCDGPVISAVRYERLDDSLHNCSFASNYTIAAAGRKLRGKTSATTMDYEKYRIQWPLESNVKNKKELEKKKESYLSEVAKAIVIIESQFTLNTKAYFENSTTYCDARENQDLIALIREIRRCGPVGTVSTGAALVGWQSFVAKPEGSRYELVHGCDGDFNEFSMRWRALRSTILSFEQVQALTETDFIRGMMRALPENDSLLSSIRSNNLASPNHTTLEQAISFLHDTITQANRDTSNCIKKTIVPKRKLETAPEESEQADQAEGRVIELLKTLIESQKKRKRIFAVCREFSQKGECSFEKRTGHKCKFQHVDAKVPAKSTQLVTQENK